MSELYHYTMQELFEMHEDAVEAYESAVENQMLDDEEHDKIVELRGEMEGIEEEIVQRKGEQA